jgi:repressor LexA
MKGADHMIGNRIKTLRESKGYNMRQMAAALNLPYTTYVNYEKGARRPNSEQLILISKYFGVSIDYLIGRTDIPFTEDRSENLFEKYPNIMPIPEMRKVPLVGAVACGKPIYREEDEWISLPTEIKADFCLRCEGDSMINAGINDGDIVFIRTCSVVENGQIAAVSIDNEVTLKRVYYYPEKNKLVLNPENPAYEPFVFVNEELNDIRILGRAVILLSEIR